MQTFHNAKKMGVDGIMFDSKLEADYYIYLKEMRDKKKIDNFSLQPRYKLIPKFEKFGVKYRAMEYIADFDVIHIDGTREVVDVKGMPTEQSKIKRKLFDYNYPNIKLSWLCKFKGERVDYFDNRKRIANNRKEKKST